MKRQTRPSVEDPRRDLFAVTLQEATSNRKLAPLAYEAYFSRTLGRTLQRPNPVGSKVSSTYVSIEATCPSSCRFKETSCYVRAGFTGRSARRLDRIAAEHRTSGLAAMRQEAMMMNEAFSRGPVPQDGGRDGRRGRDLRLHVGGDVAGGSLGLRALRAAAQRWRDRGGGAIWLYTHRWREHLRASFGVVLQVLASVETVEDATLAIRRGYVPAIVVERFPGPRRFKLRGLPRGWSVVPCPAETKKTTCVACRLCLDTAGLRRRKTAIGFQLHGPQRKKVHLPLATQTRMEFA